ncbi:MAG: NUDIX hydrolase [Armatimonadetes bacterium]|nr:NUDIX hydrolase [Armatimonadota bacterium]MDW8027063.1 NUDIX hydrolase [Armatimonadota bacterium]
MSKLEERMLNSEKIFEGRLIGLRRDEVQLSDGRKSVREVVIHPGAIAVVPIMNDGKVLLVRQFRYAVGKTLIEIPAGTLNLDETPEECAQRELSEETGFTAGKLERLTSLYLAPGYSTELIYLFIATELKPTEGERDQDEILEVVKMPLEEAIVAIERGEIQDAKTIAALLLVKKRLSGLNGS